MKWKKNIKRGSYIVEAALILPLFILTVTMFISVIPVIASCENAVFAAADEMRMESVRSSFRRDPLPLETLTARRIKEENPRIQAYRTVDLRYRYTKEGISDLITLQGETVSRENAPFGLFGEVDFDFRITGRAFTGNTGKRPALSREEFETARESQPVYVFPRWGKKYHRIDCSYVRANCFLTVLNEDIKMKYRPCSKCQAGKAKLGTPVFCFSKNGKSYHSGDCKVVKRYYIKMEKEEAERKGYSPCSRCGGI